MILSGPQITAETGTKRITIDPFDPARVEPNSYGFRLGSELVVYDSLVLDAHQVPSVRTVELPADGRTLLPGRLYLGRTLEVLGSTHYAATLYACRSVATLGVWITYSAPLGHTGAVIVWTLEIRVTQPVILYPAMTIGKIAFWTPQGDTTTYDGKYTGSRTTMPSRLSTELAANSPRGPR